MENSSLHVHTATATGIAEDMGGRLELDEVVTGLMKLRGPVSKTAPWQAATAAVRI